MKTLVFVSNSNVPKDEVYNQKGNYKLNNVELPIIKATTKMGYNFILGVNRKYPEKLKSPYNIKFYNSNTYRNIFDFKANYKAYQNLNEVIKNNNVEIIHCNTPIGGVIGRLCGKKNKIKKVIYTAHGFHFYKGAPFINNTIFKLAEKILARHTDAIITMNKEDYESAKKFRLKNNGKVYFVHGVGIDSDQFQNVEVDEENIRSNLGLKMDDTVLISVGDLVKGKNNAEAIEAIAKCKNKKLHYLVCGEGPEKENLVNLSEKLNISDQVHFIGFRTDIKELLKIANIFIFTTKREGLPRSLMEAMASGTPCIVSNVRGNVDLIKDDYNGLIYSSGNIGELTEKIKFLSKNKKIQNKFKENNLKEIQKYDKYQ